MSDPRLVRPVTVERLRTAVARRGEYVRDVAAGVIGQHEGRAYEVVLEGAEVRIRTRWSRLLPAATRAAASQLVNDWNRDRILPTLYTEATPDGVSILASLTVSGGAGLSHEQLADVIEVTVAVSAHAMRALGASIPLADGAGESALEGPSGEVTPAESAEAETPADVDGGLDDEIASESPDDEDPVRD